MKVAIFGASGGTGRLLTAKSLERGYEVTALVRSPARFPYRDRVRMVEGDALDPAKVHETVAGSDAVLSALGQRTLGKEQLLERAVPLIVTAMQQTGVQRIIVLGAAGIEPDAFKCQPAPLRWLIQGVFYRLVLKWPIASQKAQWKALSASGLDWTVVMPPKLVNSRGRGRYCVYANTLPPYGLRIARADVAEFMLQQIGNPEWVGKGVYIAW
jgi:putative NADH-flavin reductase